MNKTILTIILSTLLGCSMAVPYGEPRRIDELKIPYCLDQVGYKCLVCGYNTETQTPTAPNLIGTACLPSKEGCTEFADLKGEKCNKAKDCYCGYNRDYWGKCVKKVIDNCVELEFSGTECKTCVSSGELGGGLSDYGLSLDAKKCIDNVANGNQWCARYSSETECRLCQAGYYLNSMKKCIKSVVGPIEDCEAITDTGDRCVRCHWKKMLSQDGMTCQAMQAPWNNPTVDDFCVEYAKAPNGDDNLFMCLQCAQGYIAVGNMKVNAAAAIPASPGVAAVPAVQAVQEGYNFAKCLKTQDLNGNFLTIDLSGNTAGEGSLISWYDCLGYVYQSSLNKFVCSIKKDKTLWGAPVPATTKVYNELKNCYDFNEVDQTCQSADDCVHGTTYEQNWLICSSEIRTCLPFCRIADGGAWCETCDDGYLPVNGKCEQVLPKGCRELNPDGSGTCLSCFTTYSSVVGGQRKYEGYVYDPIAKTCNPAPEVVARCISYAENGACAKCDSWSTLNANNRCVLTAPSSTATRRIYGCAAEGDQCTKPLPGFTCAVDGTRCWVIRQDCHSYSPTTGECDVCITFGHWKQYDNNKGKYVCQSMPSDSYCEKTRDGCTCEECQAGGLALTSCRLWNDPAQTVTPGPYDAPPINGCLIYSSSTVCTTCEIGFQLSSDGKACYDLIRSRGWFTYSGVAATTALQAKIPEPCSAVTNIDECTTCDTAYDSGMHSVAGGTNTDAKWAKKVTFCVFNLERTQSRQTGLGNDGSLLNVATSSNYKIAGCMTYTADFPLTQAGDTCAAPNSPWTGAAGSQALVHTQLGDGYPLLTNVCAPGGFDGTQCTACPNGFYLTSAGVCSANIGNCLVVQASDVTCTKCAPGYSLDTVLKTQCQKILGTAPAGCSGTWWCAVQTLKWSAGSTAGTSFSSLDLCNKGTETKSANCAPKISGTDVLIPDCEKIGSSNNNCEKCKTGFVLSTGSSDLPDASNIRQTKCTPAITGCILYDNSGTCTKCGMNPVDGSPLTKDSKGNVCVAAQDSIPGCKVYQINDATTCLQCETGRGSPAEGCQNQDALCRSFDVNQGRCTSCYGDNTPNYKGLCVPKKYLAGCATAYNSTTCLSCDSGYTLIKNSANEESEHIGVCASLSISNCLIANEKNTECLRCYGGYSNLGGICVANEGNIPSNCAEIRYDANKKSLYCYECVRGFAIDGNYTTCTLNNHPCSDVSGGKDCYKLDKLVGFEIPAKCADYGRSSSSLITFSALIAFFFYLII